MSQWKRHDNLNNIGYAKDHSIDILTPWIQLWSKGITPLAQQ